MCGIQGGRCRTRGGVELRQIRRWKLFLVFARVSLRKPPVRGVFQESKLLAVSLVGSGGLQRSVCRASTSVINTRQMTPRGG